eukprot:GFKZ01001265.1.p1 GENE.GFKZ01001265.1~~GFKZ01001265.1.p1  ORF type:complete len:369 (-),score=48.27 GFKZ01001265.1:551-1657(-)
MSALRLVTDITTYETLLTALCTTAYAAYRANESLFKPSTSSSQPTSLASSLIEDNSRVLEGPLALAFPVIATLSIVLLFFFLRSVGVILTALSAISGFFSLLFLFWPLSQFLGKHLRSLPAFVSLSAAVLEPAISCLFSTFVLLTWLFSGHWLANNLIGVALCILFASLCKVPSLKVTVILFTGLFVYDIFFVFFSEHIFGRNVMVEVATSTPTNPAAALANFLHLPFSPVPNLALPAKLIFPAGDSHQTILGLGDVILPEILLVFLLEFDLRNRVAVPLWRGYFLKAWIAYAAGLMASFFFSYTFQTAQPALLYIVPMVVIPTVVLARTRGQLAALWNGAVRDDGEASGSDVDQSRVKEGEGESLLG